MSPVFQVKVTFEMKKCEEGTLGSTSAVNMLLILCERHTLRVGECNFRKIKLLADLLIGEIFVLAVIRI